MNKAQLIDSIAKKSELSKTDVRKALDAFIEATNETLKSGDKISLVGFGTFSTSERKERTGRNPQTGKEISIPKKNVVKFKPGSELSSFVN